MQPNESELLMRDVGNAVSDFYVKRGRVENGKPKISSHQVLNALAALAGALAGSAPSSQQEECLREFIECAATHAGFTADVTLARMQ